MDSKPTTITADELQSLRAVKDEPLKDPFNLRALLDKGLVVIHNNGMSLTPTGREVLTQAEMQQPATASEDTAPTGAGDDPLVVKYGDGYAAGYADGLSDYNAELASLRAQVAALQNELQRILDIGE